MLLTGRPVILVNFGNLEEWRVHSHLWVLKTKTWLRWVSWFWFSNIVIDEQTRVMTTCLKERCYWKYNLRLLRPQSLKNHYTNSYVKLNFAVRKEEEEEKCNLRFLT